MQPLFKTLTVFFLLTGTKSYGQAIGCDTVYNNPETMPQYRNDLKGLSDYLTMELVPVIADCIKRDTSIIASLYILLTIDSNGEVIDATFPRPNLTTHCKDDLKQKLLTMGGWTAGQHDGRPVCSNYNWPIRCLKWE